MELGKGEETGWWEFRVGRDLGIGSLEREDRERRDLNCVGVVAAIKAERAAMER